MTLINEFVPTAGYPNLRRIRKNTLLMLLFPLLVLLVYSFLRRDKIIVVVFYVIVFVLLSVRLITIGNAVQVTVSTMNGTFTYKTVNILGNERMTTVTLLTAKIRYKYARLTRYRSGYKLTLYNSYFGKRILLKQSEDGTGFNEEQLDQMVALINQYKEVPA